MFKAEITDVKRRRPNHAIGLWVSTGNGGGGETALVNSRGLEVLMKYFKVQKPSELNGKAFESEEFEPIKALKALFKHNYPTEKKIVVTDFKQKPRKYDPRKWTITSIDSKSKYLVIGPKEEEYRVIYLKGCRPGFTWDSYGPVYLREKSQKILIDYFNVSTPEELIGKEFRVNVSDPATALYALIARIVDPDLI